jgi:hypothetical protein
MLYKAVLFFAACAMGATAMGAETAAIPFNATSMRYGNFMDEMPICNTVSAYETTAEHYY